MLTIKTAKALGMRHIINFLKNFRQDINEELYRMTSPCGLLVTMLGVTFTIVGREKSYALLVEGVNSEKNGGPLEFKLGRKQYLVTKTLLNDLEVFFHKHFREDYEKAKLVLENDIKTIPPEPIGKNFSFFDKLLSKEKLINVKMFDGVFSRNIVIDLSATMSLRGKLDSSVECYVTTPVSQLFPLMHKRIYKLIGLTNNSTLDHDAWLRSQVTKFITKMFY